MASRSFKTQNDFYTTKEVLEKTLMSRFTLRRYTQAKTFPGPDPLMSTGARCFYPKDQVDKWIKDNKRFVNERSKSSETILQTKNKYGFDMDPNDLRLIRAASKALQCDLEIFMKDAVVWKAKQVLRRLEYEAKYD